MKHKKSQIYWETTIPSHWDEIKGKYIFTHIKEIIGDNWINEQRISLTYDGVIPRDNDDTNGLNPESLSTYQIIRENELLFKLIDLENEKTSRVGLSHFSGITSSAYIRINVKGMYPQYYYYWYYSLWFRYIFNRLGNGVRSTLNAKDLLNLLVPVPPSEEQIKISAIIDEKIEKINQLIQNQQQQIEKLKEYKQSLISEVVTKGLDPNVELENGKINWINESPIKWKIGKIKHVGKVQGRIGFKGYTVQDLVCEDDKDRAIVLGGTNISRNGSIDYNKLTYLDYKKYLESPEIMLRGGEILMTKVGAGTGENAIYDYFEDRVTINPNVMIIKEINKMSSKYLNYQLMSNHVKIDIYLESNKSGAQPAINQSYVSNMQILIPSIGEQNQIVNHLDFKTEKLETLIEFKNRKIEELNSYKKSLIYEYVTGKKEVS
jgi:type I restriction enzyme S subunit